MVASRSATRSPIASSATRWASVRTAAAPSVTLRSIVRSSSRRASSSSICFRTASARAIACASASARAAATSGPASDSVSSNAWPHFGHLILSISELPLPRPLRRDRCVVRRRRVRGHDLLLNRVAAREREALELLGELFVRLEDDLELRLGVGTGADRGHEALVRQLVESRERADVVRPPLHAGHRDLQKRDLALLD